jgi:hypothetical protein
MSSNFQRKIDTFQRDGGQEISRIIGEVWKQGNKHIRDVISLGKLLRKGDGQDEIEGIVKTLAKYT